MYGLYKVGKTPICMALDSPEGNYLIVDYDGGATEAYGCRRAVVNNYKDQAELVGQLKAMKQAAGGKKPFKFIIMDTISLFEQGVGMEYANLLFKKTKQGSKFNPAEDGDVVDYLAQGGGWPWVRKAVENIVIMYQDFADHVIMNAHVKDSVLSGKEGKDVLTQDISLMGQNKGIQAAKADAVGYLYRKGKENYLSFVNRSPDTKVGSRFHHLNNIDIKISWIEKPGFITVDWSPIFPFITKKDIQAPQIQE